MPISNFPIELEFVNDEFAGKVERLILPSDPGKTYEVPVMKGDGAVKKVFIRTDRWRLVDGLRTQVYREEAQ